MGKFSKLVSPIISLSFVIAAPAAVASTTTVGTISQIHFMNTGQVLFYTSGTFTAQPACATVAGRFAINATTPTGQAMLSGLLTAYSTHIPIVIVGTGSCPDWGDSESVSYFYYP